MPSGYYPPPTPEEEAALLAAQQGSMSAGPPAPGPAPTGVAAYEQEAYRADAPPPPGPAPAPAPPAPSEPTYQTYETPPPAPAATGAAGYDQEAYRAAAPPPAPPVGATPGDEYTHEHRDPPGKWGGEYWDGAGIFPRMDGHESPPPAFERPAALPRSLGDGWNAFGSFLGGRPSPDIPPPPALPPEHHAGFRERTADIQRQWNNGGAPGALGYLNYAGSGGLYRAAADVGNILLSSVNPQKGAAADAARRRLPEEIQYVPNMVAQNWRIGEPWLAAGEYDGQPSNYDDMYDEAPGVLQPFMPAVENLLGATTLTREQYLALPPWLRPRYGPPPTPPGMAPVTPLPASRPPDEMMTGYTPTLDFGDWPAYRPAGTI